jgi:hypothetical protein
MSKFASSEMSTKCKPLTITEPESWIVAAKEQARREGVSLSAWIGECLLANLDEDLRRNLGERPAPWCPKKVRAE